jgi:molecular chaperone HtpG
MEQHEIKINLPGLLRMLGYNIYADPEASVREMIQNAHDTCIIRKTKDKGFTDPRIHISYDKAQKTLTFADNGAGMTEEELHEYLSTIGRGFTELQKKDLREAGVQEALLLIGQFGIGLLSAFSVAEKVEIYTRSYQTGSPGFKWTCEGDIHYTVEPTEVPDPGTRVVLHLSDSSLVLLDDRRLTQAIKKYADFLSIPIFLKGNQVNSCTPPWETEGDETDYADYIQARYDLYPLAIIPFQFSDPLPLDGLLFVPMIPFELTRDFGEVDVYISRMFIKANDKELLPGWARFIKGVINTPDLTPTVSRDEMVRDKNHATIRAMLGEFILGYLAYLQEQDPQRLDLVVGAYNNTIKARSVDDDDFFDRICDLVRVSTSAGSMSMKEYLSKSEGTIYYFSERGTATQHKLLFAYKGLPVIDASWGVEEEFLGKYAQRKGVKLERLEADSGIIFKVPETVDEKWQDLARQFRLQLHKEARAVAFEPSTVPAVLVAKPIEQDDKQFSQFEALEELGLGSTQIRRMFQQLDESRSERAVGEDTILHLNTTNPLMQQLRDMNYNETFRLALTAIHNNATMFAHHYVSLENAEIFFSTNNAAISAMIGNARALEEVQAVSARMEIELGELKRKMPQVRLSEHRSCFFAYPFRDPFHALRDEIKRTLASEYGIQLMATSLEIKDSSVVEDIKNQIAEAHFGIADITGNNPNVLWELGLMIGYGKPVIILKDQADTVPTPFDVYGHYRIPYQIVKDDATGDVVYALLEQGLVRNLKRIFAQHPELERAEKWTG